MTREEAIEVIRKEYACVDADCDIERSCGKCELHMPSKEPILKAYEMAIQALSQEPCSVLEQIQADIYEHFMAIDGGVHDKSALKCMEIIDKYKASEEISERNMKMWEEIFKAERR